jgi:hypothetical protein
VTKIAFPAATSLAPGVVAEETVTTPVAGSIVAYSLARLLLVSKSHMYPSLGVGEVHGCAGSTVVASLIGVDEGSVRRPCNEMLAPISPFRP